MGSPDPFGRQLDGMGSGVSSTSKIVVLGEASRDDVDVDFTFVQIGIRDGAVDMGGNCGNMSAMVGPAAWDMGLVKRTDGVEVDDRGVQWSTVRFFNTNTRKVMAARFKVGGSPLRYCHQGSYVMDGVEGGSSPITMRFLDPAGAKTGRALPTSNPVDTLTLSDGSSVMASLVDVGNPGIFVSAASLGMASSSTPASVEADEALKARLSEVRRVGTAMMGLDPSIESVPKIVVLLPPGPNEGERDDGIDIRCLAMSMGQAHKAVPLTLALCLGAASQMPGTIAADMIRGRELETVTIGHPSGRVDVGTTVRGGEIVEARLLRTGRVLMRGEVCY